MWQEPKHPGNTWATLHLCSLLEMCSMSPNIFLNTSKGKRILFKFVHTIICFWRPVAVVLVLLFHSDGDLMNLCPYSVSASAIPNLNLYLDCDQILPKPSSSQKQILYYWRFCSWKHYSIAPFANNDLLTCRNMDRRVITVKIECIIIHCWCIKVYKLLSKALCLILHCQINGVFQEDVLQVVVISGWWMSTNKLSLEFSLCVLFSFVLSFRVSGSVWLLNFRESNDEQQDEKQQWSAKVEHQKCIYYFFFNCSAYFQTS